MTPVPMVLPEASIRVQVISLSQLPPPAVITYPSAEGKHTSICSNDPDMERPDSNTVPTQSLTLSVAPFHPSP